MCRLHEIYSILVAGAISNDLSVPIEIRYDINKYNNNIKKSEREGEEKRNSCVILQAMQCEY